MDVDHNPPNGGGGDTSEDDDFQKLLRQAGMGVAEGEVNLLEGITDRPLEIGEKADDAIDYEDIGDDDLPEEEFESGEGDDAGINFSGTTVQDSGGAPNDDDVNMDDLFGDNVDDDDDLFGDGMGLSDPIQKSGQHEDDPMNSIEDLVQQAFNSSENDKPQPTAHNAAHGIAQQDLEEEDPEVREQMALFAQSMRKKDEPAIAHKKTSREEFEKIWPNFEEDKPPRFFSLVPRKRAFYIPKVPQKAPKSFQMNKLSLDLATDQEKAFRLHPTTTTTAKPGRQQEEEQGGIIHITSVAEEDGETDEQLELENLETIDDREMIGNISWSDLRIACEDWEIPDESSVPALADSNQAPSPPDSVDIDQLSPNKKRKLGSREKPIQFSVYDHMDLPTWDDPELETARFLPALKLQYPFYKVALSDRELRSFHRPTVTFKPGERASISTLRSVKRKHKKNLKPSEAFASAEDLNIGDNSDLLLAEYSEEYPTTLSNFGMGVKILNYYRRKDMDDTARPKPEDGIGETSVLLPQDKSPFSLFGTVEPGQQVLTLHNAMYRAPVFKHKPEETDFLVSRSYTGVNGNRYYMRNIPNLMVVGQQFPSVEVPGTHARKVTEASKKRLKMLAFRLYRKGQQKGARQPWVSNEMIKQHLPGTEIAQNRSRMREIMKYQKDIGTWEPVPGETVPEEPILRTWIKPEDVCLIDSMHAGDKQLQDAGIKSNEIRDDDDEADNENADVKLAPWNTTKNFLNACAGKAMLELHGDGDPTGQGLGFSFIKVSMKGGFRDVGESAADRLDNKKMKELGGHSYNVQRQQVMYENAIKRIWNKQKESLSAQNPPSDTEDDVDSAVARNNLPRQRSEVGTPMMRHDDETMSQMSRNSNADNRGKKLKITRTIKNQNGEFEDVTEIITDPAVIQLYIKHKRQERLLNMRIEDIKPTGDPEVDKAQQIKLKTELARLARNIERREGREKAKGLHKSQTGEGGASATGGPGKGGATPRKCANCGEVGHIKTNKKLCPLLNGQRKQNDTFRDASAASPVTVVPATPSFAGSPS
ncbi:transcription factor TFIID complex subunit Taf111 [Pyrenophora tritici-repentis Pt-1C-BFP]|uniref:Transcription factor TFIID complex subunit Taf111 n=1 Tax=Pyrenophora tritici-repentis (strain Pt-1C-BFP) TaxID=426418 RepID=B2VXR3_PYRTR|nr:transcription factor TFIID complex subunit Taf111 [Pyrenophora tritici-repentis Pt-1C-BFP]EDU45832.1 transcription factor TFIID complex subunit Taf111 [Pyrenophora tritici-repentis Pt-1C-BFP]